MSDRLGNTLPPFLWVRISDLIDEVKFVVTVNGALIAIFLVAVPVAFSSELVEGASDAGLFGWPSVAVVTVVDWAVLSFALALSAFYHPELEDLPERVDRWWVRGAAITILLDIFVGVLPSSGNLPIKLGVSVLYVIALAYILATLLGASPWMLVSRRLREKHRLAWDRYRMSIPLLAGTLAAYIASTLWDADLAAVTVEGEGHVDQEYFAQISQVIPLLFVALAVEARFLSGQMAKPAHRALAVTTVFFLGLGEVLALFALPKSGDDGNTLNHWHEYLTFVITLEACTLALATLILAALFPAKDAPPRSEVPEAAQGMSAP